MLNKHLQTTEKEQNRPKESRREAVIIKITEMEETEKTQQRRAAMSKVCSLKRPLMLSNT